MVFTPAAVINYTFVPLQHRALFIQTVALGQHLSLPSR